ncbi:MAG: sigma-70 family RNA polymerase sigma factor [Clostridia bacterium]|nr:sigma-70 family RNA polymerase sigma factor [Clostridia bacterium]
MIFIFLVLWHKLRHFFIPVQSLYYIGNGRSMPPPLTAEEEAALLERYPDPEIKEILIERNLRLVVYLARKYESSGTPLEDLVSIGTIGLIKAIHTFRPDKNIKLATYASRCISNEILMHLRKIAPLRSEVSLDDPLKVDGDGNELLLSDILGTEEDLTERPLEESSERSLLRNAVNRLPTRERAIISLRFGMNAPRELTQKEVADKMGISQSYISRLEKKIVAKLRRELDKVMST